MPKPRLQAQRVAPKPDVQIRYNYSVRTVKAISGGKFTDTGEFQCGPDPHNAKSAADRMQREFDDDCDPCRTYVHRVGDPIPVYAGLQMKEYGGYRGI